MRKEVDDHVVFSITDPWMPQPQLRFVHKIGKYMQQESQTLLYGLSTDPQETKSVSEIPSFLEGIQETYKNQILSKVLYKKSRTIQQSITASNFR